MSADSAFSGRTSGRTVKRKSWRAWAFFLVFLMAYAWAYTYLGTILIQEKNTSRINNIQGAYLDATYQTASLSEGNLDSKASLSSRFTRMFPQYTDGVIDPLLPWLTKTFADEPPDELFEKGKWLNMLLACVLLVMVGVGAAKAFSFAGASALILMGGFGVILERSTYFSSDALYYLLIVFAWLCALSLIRQNHLWLYGVFGVLLGIAFLARASVWPLVAGFLFVSFIRTVASLVWGRKNSDEESLWNNANQLVGIAILITAFLLVAGPRLSYASSKFGDPFHHYSKYFVWLESSGEAARFQRTYSDGEALSNLSWKEKPGVYRFVKERGFSDLLSRGWKGGIAQLTSSVLGRSGWILIYGVGVFGVIASIHRWVVWRQSEETWRVRGTSARWMLIFTAVVCCLTLFYCGIGNNVIPNSAMTTSLFLPILLTFIWISERYRRQLQRSSYAGLVNRVYLGLMSLPIAWICFRIVLAIQTPVVA